MVYYWYLMTQVKKYFYLYFLYLGISGNLA
jgi:hypothetical protein